MKVPITDETLFKDLIQQIEVAVNAIATQVTYTAAQILLIAFTLIEQLETYRDSVKEWQKKTHRRQNIGSIQGFLRTRIQGSAHGTMDVTGRGLLTILPQKRARKCGNTHRHADNSDSSVSQPHHGNGIRPPQSHRINDYECDVDSATANRNRNHRNAANAHQQIHVFHTTDALPTKNTSRTHPFGPATRTRALGPNRLLQHTRVFIQLQVQQ